MYGGYTNRILRIDLTSQKTEIQQLDENLAKNYVGGSGIGTKLFYDETAAQIAPLSPENVLMFMTGPLTGTGVPGTGRHEVVFKSPLTGIFARSGVGGSWGVELKRAGFDGLILTGKADKPVYLWIHDGKVQFRDATDLWGKDTYEAASILKDGIKKKASVAVIGLAGEKKIKIAGIAHEGDHARMAGRCGGGAVMGSKNIKAIMVYGTENISIHQPEELKAYIKEMFPHITEVTKGMREFGTAGGIPNYEKLGNFPHKNWALSDWEEGANKISGQEMARTILTGRYACRHCPVACGRVVKISKGPFAPVNGGGPEYETLAALGSNCLVDDLDAIAKANELCNRYGLDTMSTGGVIGFAMEAYEKGLIGKKDTGGIELKWGDSAAMVAMVQKIGEQEDIGELLGEGVKRAALEIGKNAIEFAIQVKGLEPSYHDPRCFFSQALSYATTNRGACHNGSQSHSCEMSGSQPDLGINKPQDRHQVEGKADFTVKLQNLMCMFDALIMCKFMHTSGAIKAEPMVKFFNYVTGWEADTDEFMKVGERIFNLQRLYNVRCGISGKDDCLPPRFLTLQRHRDKLPPIGQLLSDYYECRGWSEDGIPTKMKRQDLGLPRRT
jgi:aldehyde:ferredoxin oxidoreductase